MKSNGKIILIPCPVIEGKTESLSTETLQNLHKTSYFIVERAKTARHFIKSTKHPKQIAELVIHEITKDTLENEHFLQKVFDGIDIGVISEAGCPGIADPGAEIVAWAHKNEIQVVPLVGPSSIFMALMASGMNGQNFAFSGYLSNKKPELIQQLKSLESKLTKTGQSQIFMETPYRNVFMIETCLIALNENTRLCVACDINGVSENIMQMKIKAWHHFKFDHYHKRPCIYIIG